VKKPFCLPSLHKRKAPPMTRQSNAATTSRSMREIRNETPNLKALYEFLERPLPWEPHAKR
jgi:hypothetical protein